MTFKASILSLTLLLSVFGSSAFVTPQLPGFQTAKTQKSGLALSLRCQEIGHVPEPLRRQILKGAVLSTLPVLVGLSQPAFAERSFTSMKVAMKNYGKRALDGLSFYENDLKALIDAEQWAEVAEAVSAPKGKAYKLAFVEKYQSGVVDGVEELKGPLRVFASAITATDSESRETQKLYTICKKYAEFNVALKVAATAGKKEDALKAWKQGAFALRLYMDTINNSIPRSVGKLEIPPAPQ